MTKKEALQILAEMQKWRRGEPPYDGDTPDTHRTMPYTSKEFGEALDTAIASLRIAIAKSDSDSGDLPFDE